MPLSLAAKQAMRAQSTNKVVVPLLTIHHPDLQNSALYLTANTEEVLSNGNLFIPFPYRFVLPLDSSKEDIAIGLELQVSGSEVNEQDNLIRIVREIEDAPTSDIQLALHDTPDSIENEWLDLTWRDARYTEGIISCELSYEDTLNEPYPGYRFDTRHFPGLF